MVSPAEASTITASITMDSVPAFPDIARRDILKLRHSVITSAADIRELDTEIQRIRMVRPSTPHRSYRTGTSHHRVLIPDGEGGNGALLPYGDSQIRRPGWPFHQ